MKLPRTRLFQLAVVAAIGVVVLVVGVYAALSLQPHQNASGQNSSDPNERCKPSPCGAPAGFEIDITSMEVKSDYLVLTAVFRNHTTPQLFEAVSYRHTSPADFTLRQGGKSYQPVFNSDCPNWPELDVPRGGSSPPRTVCFAVTSASGATLVWNPDLGVIDHPVSIALA
ncbi:MAG TPA: hypothetical protein VFR33_10280 [Candidatus Dormibacteraeota bacterium]|nr:hypothetical protein [Candidatus Dormibacteraeota bacterium]